MEISIILSYMIPVIPDFSYEKNLRKDGCRFIVGVDEVGVGPLAGPVTACAVSVPALFAYQNLGDTLEKIKNLRDSKKLSRKQREEFAREFMDAGEFIWESASVSVGVIDRLNIYQARMEAAKRAVLKLEKAMAAKSDFLILDGRGLLKMRRKQQAIVKGDEKVALCAIASIIAKVRRDKTMLRLHKKYPEYRFDLHKGYGTKLHFKMIKKYGPCEAHRKSFIDITL